MFNKKVLNELVEFYGSVLHLRGNETKSQPIEICGNYLLFNGEIYGGISVCSEENDAEKLSKLLEGKSEREFLQILSLIEGEWAFAYYNVALNCVYFGRDFLGKRSLLIHLPENSADSLLISSVSSADTQILGYWKEVETRGIFKVDLSEDISNLNIQCLEWGIDGLNQPNFNLNPDLSKIDELGVVENEGKQLPNVRTWSESENAVALNNLMGLLDHSVKCRVTTIPPPLA
jgi:asparagine synthetase B (glutamine-hydrolysing)